jgi:phosphate-selective porin OprO/OprP
MKHLLPCAVLALTPSIYGSSVEERLNQLEHELAVLRAENAQLRHEFGLPADKRPGRIQPAGTEDRLAVGGFLQLQADALDRGDSRFTSSNDRFYIRRARFNLSGKLQDRVDFRVELELAGSLAETSAYRAQATDAWVAIDLAPYARLRAGQLKTPFGYEQLSSDLKAFTIERSLANDRLTFSRQIGLQLEGLIHDRVTYAAGAFNGSGTNTNANDNDSFLWAARVATRPVPLKLAGSPAELTSGINAYISDDRSLSGQPSEFSFDSVSGGTCDNIFAGNRRGVGIDAQFRFERIEIWAEYLRAHFEPTNRLPHASFNGEGWYLQGACFVVPKKIQAVLKFETFDPAANVRGNSTDTWTTGLNWLLKGDDFKVMTNYLLTDTAGMPDHRQKIIVRLQTVF